MALERTTAALAAEIERGEAPGAVAAVLRDGRAEITALGRFDYDGGPPMARDTLFRIASVTKPIAATVAMMLVEDGKIALESSVEPWLPELADRRVLKDPLGRADGPTVPAARAITLEDLLTLRFGLGFVAFGAPINQAMEEKDILIGPAISNLEPDAWMARLGELPLASQPGEAWHYQTGLDVLGVLLARVEGEPLEAVFRRRLFEPLGMADTSFQVAADQLHRLPPFHCLDDAGHRALFDPGGAESRYASPPPFPSAGGGLVSTVDDLLAFGGLMLGKGEHKGLRLLAPESVEALWENRLTHEQRRSAAMFLDGHGWGLGMGARLPGDPGLRGWDGGYGTSFRFDPEAGLLGVLLTQQLWQSPSGPAILGAFWDSVSA